MTDDQHAKVEARHRELWARCVGKSLTDMLQEIADYEREVAAQARREALEEAAALGEKGICTCPRRVLERLEQHYSNCPIGISRMILALARKAKKNSA